MLTLSHLHAQGTHRHTRLLEAAFLADNCIVFCAFYGMTFCGFLLLYRVF